MKRCLPVLGLTTCLAALLVAGCYSTSIKKAEENVPLEPAILKDRPPLPLAQRKRVAVLEFEDRTDYGHGRLGRAASNVLLTYLDRSQQFAIYERESLAKIMDEQKLGHSEGFDAAKAVELGKMAGVELVFIGAVSNYGYHSERTEALIFGSHLKQQAEAVVDVRIIEVATGRIVASESGRGVVTVDTGKVLGIGTSAGYDETTANNALRAAIGKYVDKLIDQSLFTR
jgi:curli biogenesis system outer membrane secretion channel CsgG